MYSHPYIASKVADERRRDLIAQADAYRLARSAREGRPAAGRQHLVAVVRLPAHLAHFVSPLARRSARPLRLRWRRAAADGS